MIECIKFTNPIFETDDDNNIISPTTNNMIILCSSTRIKNILSDEIENLNEDDGADYASTDWNEVEIKTVIRYKPTSVYAINGEEQRIIITVEDPFILTSENIWDIWFADINKNEKIEIYPFAAFKGYQEVWDKGIDMVYRDVLAGRYGNFGKYGR